MTVKGAAVPEASMVMFFGSKRTEPGVPFGAAVEIVPAQVRRSWLDTSIWPP